MPSICPDVEYIIAAVNCGVCPNSTFNVSAVCRIDDLNSAVATCAFSVQTYVCDSTISEENSNVVVAVLKSRYSVHIYNYDCIIILIYTIMILVPQAPKFKRILPYYSSLNKLKKTDIQFNTITVHDIARTKYYE